MTRRTAVLAGIIAGALSLAAVGMPVPALAADAEPIAVAADGAVPVDPAFDGPQVTRVRILEEAKFLEIHWDRYVDEVAAVSPGSITLTNGSTVVDLVARRATGPTDTIFFDRDNRQIGATAARSMARLPADLHMASIAYRGTIDPTQPLTLTIAGTAVTDSAGRAAKTATYSAVPRLPHYTQKVTTASGIDVKAGPRVDPAVLALAADQVDVMLGNGGSGVATRMAEDGCSLAVYAARENAYTVPEHRRGYDPGMYDVEGYGGSTWNGCVSSVSERNVLRTRGDQNPYLNTGYPDENILVHEFGHAVRLVGIETMADAALSEELRAVYQNARDAGLWPNTYAISNIDEYFATLSAIWFDNMSEARDWSDGVRSPVNTRAELRHYDPEAHALLAKVYPSDRAMPAPWDVPSPDVHHPPAPSLGEVALSVAARCVAAKVVLVVVIRNGEGSPVDAVLATDFGATQVAGIAGGTARSQIFVTRARSIAAGELTATLSATVDGRAISLERAVPYPSADC